MAKFIAESNQFATQFSFKALFPTAADDLKAKADFETKENKLVEGKIQWKTNLTAIVLDEHGNEVRADTNVGLAILSKVDIKDGVAYKPAGKVRITPYVTSNNRLGLSIVADSIVPVGGNEQK